MGAYITWMDGFIPQEMGFDAVLSESHELVGEVTKHPVEKGSDITDHMHLDPEVVTLEVLVTNAPITDKTQFGLLNGFISPVFLNPPSYDPPFAPTPGAVFSAIGGAVRSLFQQKREYTATVLQFARTQDNIRLAQEQLWELVKDRTLVTVHTKGRVYSDMLLVRAPATRRPDLGEAVQFQLEFHQIRIAESQSAFLPKEIIAKPKIDKGIKSPRESTKTSVALGQAGGANAVVNFLRSKQ